MQSQFPLPELSTLEPVAGGPFAVERPGKIGDVRITYTRVREILTRATGFMDAYDFTLNPYGGLLFWLHLLLRSLFQSRHRKARQLGQVGDRQGERR